MADLQIRYKPLPTQSAFVESEAVVVVIYSNTGEGKTWAGIWGMLRHAQRCGKPIRVAIVRDTLENLKTSIVRSIEEFFQSSPSAFRFWDGYKKLTIYLKDENKKALTITADLFGIDDPAALSKLQGPEYALIWLNEPAPISDSERLSAGLSEDVFKVALVRCARQKGTQARLQVDMNPADEDHWTHRLFLEEDIIDPENPLITKAVFRVPYGENIYVSEVSRQAVRAAYKDDPASYERYVLGQFAKVYRGPAVTPTYNRTKHLWPSPLIPAPGLVSFAFFDSWSNPACVLGQITQYNRLIFLNTLRLDGSDIETLIELQVIPLLESPRWKGKSKAWRIGGDPTMTNMDQSSRLVSAAKKVEKYFGARFEKGPTEWRMIQNHLLWALRQPDQRGEPMILLSADNKILDKALAGGWHYHINAQGNKTITTPVKDEACVDKETEILTFQGWMKESELILGESVYGYDMKSEKLIEATLLDVHRYNSKQYDVIHYNGQQIDMMVTPNHNCIASRRSTTRDKANGGFREIQHKFDFVKAENLHSGHNILYVANQHLSLRIPKDVEFSDEFIKLCAWVMTEGTYRKDGSIIITQSRGHNPKYIQEIEKLLGYFPTSTHSKNPVTSKEFTSSVWRIFREVAILMKQFMPNKYPSSDFINKMTQSQKRLFLYEAIKGDGDWGPDQINLERIQRNRDFWTNKKTPRICTMKKKEADAIQHIASLIGMNSTINKTCNSYKVSLIRQGAKGGRLGIIKPVVKQVSFVWCPTTTTGTWIARRNGRVFITGNSHFCDAWAAAVCVLMPSKILLKQSPGKYQELRKRSLQRAQTYAVQGGRHV